MAIGAPRQDLDLIEAEARQAPSPGRCHLAYSIQETVEVSGAGDRRRLSVADVLPRGHPGPLLACFHQKHHGVG